MNNKQQSKAQGCLQKEQFSWRAMGEDSDNQLGIDLCEVFPKHKHTIQVSQSTVTVCVCITRNLLSCCTNCAQIHPEDELSWA